MAPIYRTLARSTARRAIYHSNLLGACAIGDKILDLYEKDSVISIGSNVHLRVHVTSGGIRGSADRRAPSFAPDRLWRIVDF